MSIQSLNEETRHAFYCAIYDNDYNSTKKLIESTNNSNEYINEAFGQNLITVFVRLDDRILTILLKNDFKWDPDLSKYKIKDVKQDFAIRMIKNRFINRMQKVQTFIIKESATRHKEIDHVLQTMPKVLIGLIASYDRSSSEEISEEENNASLVKYKKRACIIS